MNISEAENQSEPPKLNSTSHSRISRNQIIIGVAFVMIAVVLNPSQDRQLDEVSKVATRRASLESDNLEHLWVPKLSTYNNYIVFSTITYEWAGSEEKMLSFGFLGIVQTTGNIGDVMVELGGWMEKAKREKSKK